MARNLPCSVCGSLMWRAKSSRPEGQATCRPCRKVTFADRHAPGVAAYFRGCRCDGCRSAGAAQQRRRYAERNGAVQPRPCDICATVFTPRHSGTKSCSAECRVEIGRRRTQKRRARKRGVLVESFARREIFDRDGWRCHICRRKLSPSHTVPHLRAATVDHLVPLSKGGLHERTNVMTACYSCNCSKRDRGGNEQLLLIG